MKKRKERERWVWEFVRRNDDYVKDFEEYGGKELEGKLGDRMIEKWRTDYLPDPGESYIESGDLPDNYPVSYSPISGIRLSGVFFDDRKELFQPGSVLERRGKIVRRFPKWTVFNYETKTFEPLDVYNCPCTITVTVLIEAHFQKKEIDELIKREFSRAYRKVSAAQKAVFKTRPSRPRFGNFSAYLRVWDLRKKENRKWIEIAKEVLPEYFEGSKPEPMIARDIVRNDYFKQADKLINGGWKEI